MVMQGQGSCKVKGHARSKVMQGDGHARSRTMQVKGHAKPRVMQGQGSCKSRTMQVKDHAGWWTCKSRTMQVKDHAGWWTCKSKRIAIFLTRQFTTSRTRYQSSSRDNSLQVEEGLGLPHETIHCKSKRISVFVTRQFTTIRRRCQSSSRNNSLQVEEDINIPTQSWDSMLGLDAGTQIKFIHRLHNSPCKSSLLLSLQLHRSISCQVFSSHPW